MWADTHSPNLTPALYVNVAVFALEQNSVCRQPESKVLTGSLVLVDT